MYDSVAFLDDCGITAVFVSHKIEDYGKYGPISEDMLLQALNILLDSSYYPGRPHSFVLALLDVKV
jgi:hypothetical protein